MKFENIRQIITHEFPGFDISAIKKIGEGENSKAFLINDDYIFRFPKRDEVKQHFKKEIEVLPKIRSQLNLEIPHFNFISKEINFVGHKNIPGKFLTPKLYNSLKQEYKIELQKTLVLFLTQLHNIDLKILSDCDLEIMNYREEYSGNLEMANALIYPNISVKDRDIITLLFTNYLSNPDYFQYMPRLIHNDFSVDHILFKNESNKLSGIIDFGDIAIGDPDYDFMYLLDSFGQQFISQILTFYTREIHKYFFEKIYFFSLANKLQILLGSIENEDDNAIKVDNQNLEKWFKKYEQYKKTS